MDRLFLKKRILTLTCQYIQSLILFVIHSQLIHMSTRKEKLTQTRENTQLPLKESIVKRL